MLLPAFRIFRLSPLDKEQEAHHLALGRAAIALGRKVLADSPQPKIPMIAQREAAKPPPQQPDSFRMQTALDRKRKENRGRRRSLERQHLSLANEHVAKAERVIRQQAALIDSLRCDGQDTKLADETMRVFEDNLKVMREHRELIIRAIEENDVGVDVSPVDRSQSFDGTSTKSAFEP